MAASTSAKPQKRLMALVVIPLLSCGFSSLVGILIRQAGNLVLTRLGEAPGLIIVPLFCGLFAVSFGLSFLFSWPLRKLLLRPQRTTV